MKTKTTIAFALLWVAATSLAAQTGKFPFPADVRFCWAPSGLNIRAEGNAKGYIRPSKRVKDSSGRHVPQGGAGADSLTRQGHAPI